MPEVHAILSASSSKRWLNCTPSARLEQNFPNESSVYAEEGTAAHALGEYKLRKYLHERVRRPTSEFDTDEMDANTDIYAEYIISTVERIKETCPHPLVMVEERLDYSYLVPQGFGTGDCVIIADGTLYVMDYKNGKGVFVSCGHNPQMMLYALGAYHAYGYLYSITKVSMTIIQPRLENISTFECSVEELLDWAETYVRPRAKLAFEGKSNKVKYGLKNCHYAKATFDEDGGVTYDTPVRIPGAVSLSLDANGDIEPFYADNIAYYVVNNNSGYEGDLEIALIPESFLTDIMHEELDGNGVLAENANAELEHFAFLFEFDGDQRHIRHVMYNCVASRPSIEGDTNEDSKEVKTDTLTLQATPLANGYVKAKTGTNTSDDVYNKWYEKVYEPQAEASSVVTEETDPQG